MKFFAYLDEFHQWANYYESHKVFISRMKNYTHLLPFPGLSNIEVAF